MNEVSCIVSAFFDSVGPPRGVHLEELIEGLPITVEHLRDRSKRMPWDVLAAMTNRFEARVGPVETVQAGREAVRTALADPLRSLGGFLVTPRRVYRTALRWITPSTHRNLRWTLNELEDGHLEVLVEIPAGYVESPAFFRIIQGALEAAPLLVGASHAHVDAEITPRRARFLVRPPAPRLRDRFAPLLRVRGLRSVLDVLVGQQRELQARDDAARASEQLYRTLLDGVNELIGIADANGRFRYTNAATQRILGYTAEELNAIDVFQLLHPEDLQLVADAFLRGTESPGLRVTLDVRVRAKDGQYRVLDASGTSMLHNPVIRGVVIHGRDITERKASEREAREREQTFATLLSSLSGMAYRCSAEPPWILDVVTEGCLALTGYEASELKGNATPSLTDLIHPEDRGHLETSRRASLAAMETSADEYRIRCKNGAVRWVADAAHGVYGSDGKLVAIEGFLTDVTARKRLEAQLEHSQRLEGIGRLAGGIAHDFNNVLGVIISYADLAQQGLEPGEQRREDIVEIERAARRAAELTSQLLAFARRQVVQPRAIDLNALTRSIDKLLRRVLGEDVRLETVLEDGLWPVKADPGQIEQVLLNLAVNARDAMPAGGRLSIETGNVLVDEAMASSHVGLEVGPYVRISVTDTGTGLSADAMEHLFEPFFTTKDPGKGTGLGLAMCYGIVRQSGGAIAVERPSEPGTTFAIWLPRAVGEVQAPSIVPPPSAASGGGEVLLLVEDYRTLRDVTARALRAHGYHVLVAASGAEALALSAAHPGEIQLLVTDVIMAGMDGHELAEKLSAQRPGIRVLYASGYMESDVLERRIGGAEAFFLPKPFTPETLARRVREILDA